MKELPTIQLQKDSLRFFFYVREEHVSPDCVEDEEEEKEEKADDPQQGDVSTVHAPWLKEIGMLRTYTQRVSNIPDWLMAPSAVNPSEDIDEEPDRRGRSLTRAFKLPSPQSKVCQNFRCCAGASVEGRHPVSADAELAPSDSSTGTAGMIQLDMADETVAGNEDVPPESRSPPVSEGAL